MHAVVTEFCLVYSGTLSEQACLSLSVCQSVCVSVRVSAERVCFCVCVFVHVVVLVFFRGDVVPMCVAIFIVVHLCLHLCTSVYCRGNSQNLIHFPHASTGGWVGSQHLLCLFVSSCVLTCVCSGPSVLLIPPDFPTRPPSDQCQSRLNLSVCLHNCFDW